MNVYKISCYSTHGSYFASYLQSVTVTANSKYEALTVVKEWLKDNSSFIYPEEKWRIEELCRDVTSGMVIDTHEDSDY